ncbi:MAG TPA: polyprenyl synthetase family protein [Solirubrobacterales bacterium]|nr:polyprenyl synthetase family protein [Solirubrobacterales bacterium]
MSTVDEVILLGGEAMPALMERVERVLEATSGGDGPDLKAAASDTLSAGGKRLRPLLVLICGGAEDADGLVCAAASVELIHMATLVHDDVVDNALLRRGRPTVFASGGRTAAMATGDFLFSRSFALLASNGDPEQVRVLSDACLALARGELAQRHDAYRLDVDEQRYLLRCELKTARLFSAACCLGGLAAGRPQRELTALEAYGRQLGLAFQMLDDLLDVSGPAERTGKHRGTDLLDGTVTLPLILADLELTDLRTVTTREQAEALCDRIAATGALEETRARATKLIADAKSTLNGKVEPSLERSLSDVADRIADRYA